MAYDSTNKKLYATAESGITLQEIAKCIGDYRVNTLGQYDMSIFCNPKNGIIKINIFSRIKPIRFNKWTKLESAEFKGKSTDAADNIYYGIKITGPISAELGPDLSEIHNTEFQYMAPRGGESEPFRLSDFNGYAHNAQPNPSASFNQDSLLAYYDDENHTQGSLGGISVRYYENNSDGVDFTDFYTDPSESLTNSLKRSYPCILVTDSLGRSYFTALDYDPNDGSIPTARPLYFNNAYTGSTNWSVRFGKPRMKTSSSEAQTKPWNSPQEGMKATLFLLKSYSLYGPYLDAMSTMNFSEYWVPLLDTMRVAGKPIVLPAPKFGVPLTLRAFGEPTAYFTPVSVSYDGTTVSVIASKTGTSSNTLTVTCRITIGVETKNTTTTVSGSLSSRPLLLFSGWNQRFMSGTTYTASVSITTIDGSKSKTQTATLYFTA